MSFRITLKTRVFSNHDGRFGRVARIWAIASSLAMAVAIAPGTAVCADAVAGDAPPVVELPDLPDMPDIQIQVDERAAANGASRAEPPAAGSASGTQSGSAGDASGAGGDRPVDDAGLRLRGRHAREGRDDSRQERDHDIAESKRSAKESRRDAGVRDQDERERELRETARDAERPKKEVLDDGRGGHDRRDAGPLDTIGR